MYTIEHEIGIEKFSDPYPHLALTNVVPPDVYAKLTFPQLQKRSQTRAGWDLFKGESEYDHFFQTDPAWGEVRKLLDSKAFIYLVVSQFRDELAELGVNVDALNLIEFTESPAQMSMARIAGGRFDGEIFSRFDLQASDGSTLRNPHVDHARRIVGGVLFFCDGEEEGLEGGDFGVWVDDAFQDDRVPHKCRMVKTMPVRHNTMYIFLNRNDAFHAPVPLTAAKGSRRWAYFSVSGRQDVWPSKQDRPAARLVNTAKDIKRFLTYHLSNRRATVGK